VTAGRHCFFLKRSMVPFFPAQAGGENEGAESPPLSLLFPSRSAKSPSLLRLRARATVQWLPFFHVLRRDFFFSFFPRRRNIDFSPLARRSQLPFVLYHDKWIAIHLFFPSLLYTALSGHRGVLPRLSFFSLVPRKVMRRASEISSFFYRRKKMRRGFPWLKPGSFFSLAAPGSKRNHSPLVFFFPSQLHQRLKCGRVFFSSFFFLLTDSADLGAEAFFPFS